MFVLCLLLAFVFICYYLVMVLLRCFLGCLLDFGVTLWFDFLWVCLFIVVCCFMGLPMVGFWGEVLKQRCVLRI